MNSVKRYNLPDGWDLLRLEELSNISIGKTPSRSKKEFFSGNNIWLSIRDLKEDVVSLSNEKITDQAVISTNMKIIPKGTLLMSFKLTLGKTSFAGCDLFTNEAIASLPIKDESVLDKYFLRYALAIIDLEKEVDNAVKGKTLNKQKLKNLEIPLPSLQEQKRIVAKIDSLFAKIDKAIALTEESLKQAGNLLPAVLKQVFDKGKEEGWEEFTFDDLKESNVIGLVRNTKQQSLDFTYKYVKMNNVTNDNLFTFDKITYVNASEDEVEKFSLKKGDFLFNTRNSIELVGKSCVFNENEENVLYNNNLMRVRFKDHINSDFILYQFSSPYLITQLNKIKSGTTNVAAIYYKSLKNISLLINTVDNQQKLVNYFNKVSKQSQTTQLKLSEQLKHLKNLKSSILSKAFSGDL